MKLSQILQGKYKQLVLDQINDRLKALEEEKFILGILAYENEEEEINANKEIKKIEKQMKVYSDLQNTIKDQKLREGSVLLAEAEKDSATEIIGGCEE